MWGAVLLTVLRMMQGIAVGGEWSGSVLMAGEWAAPDRRGLTSSFPQMGSPLGLIAGHAAGADEQGGRARRPFMLRRKDHTYLRLYVRIRGSNG